MKKKRAQQSAWRRNIDRDIAQASLAQRRVRVIKHPMALTPHVVNAAVGTDVACPPSSGDVALMKF